MAIIKSNKSNTTDHGLMPFHSNSLNNINPFAFCGIDPRHCDRSEMEEHW